MQIPWGTALSIGFLAVVTMLHGDVLLSSRETLMAKYPGDTMDIRNVKTPVLTGAMLRAFAFASRMPLVGPLMYKLLARDNQLIQVREFSSLVNDMPIYYPIHYPTQDELAHHNAQPNDFSGKYRPLGDKFAFKRWTIQDYTELYKTGDVTPLQVAKAILHAIDESNAQDIPLRAVISINRDEVLTEAQASTARYAAKRPNGILDGVPILVKDEIPVKGYRSTHGTSFLATLHGPALEDAIPVARLRAAGAMVMGKTNMHELGLGTTGLNNAFGAARNPYDKDHMTGGSSSGSAAAVAAGLVPLAVGADGSGSVRIPSALCGVVGVKATFMRIPFHFEGAPSVANVGPLAATVQDAALAYAIMSGEHDSIPMSRVQPRPHIDLNQLDSVDMTHIRIGIYHDYMTGTDPELMAKFWEQKTYLESLGATFVNVTIPNLQTLLLAQLATILSEEVVQADNMYEHIASCSPEVQSLIQLGRLGVTGMDLMAAQVVRGYGTRIMNDIFKSVDVLLTPSTATLAPRIEPEYLSDGLLNAALAGSLMRYIFIGNFIGIPSVTVPVGYSSTGLPTSLLVQGAHWNDAATLHVARVLEKNSPLRQPPSFFYEIFALSKKQKA